MQLWPYWGVENKIIVFPINEGSNRERCHGNKIFYILELLFNILLHQCTKFYLILTSNVYTKFDLNIVYVPVLLVTSQVLLKWHEMLNFLIAFFLKISETLKAHISGTETDINK